MNREDFTTRGECLNPEIESVDSAPSGTIACDTRTYVHAIAVDETLIFFFFFSFFFIESQFNRARYRIVEMYYTRSLLFFPPPFDREIKMSVFQKSRRGKCELAIY